MNNRVIFLFILLLLASCKNNDPFLGAIPVPNPETNTWVDYASMPTARQGISNTTVEANGKIYVMGGVNTEGVITDKLEIFDVASNSWVEGSPIPISVSQSCAVRFDDKIYLFGGFQSLDFPFDPVDKIFEYDIASDTWTEKQSMAKPRGGSAAVLLTRKIHVLGGFYTSSIADHDVYDPATNLWTSDDDRGNKIN